MSTTKAVTDGGLRGLRQRLRQGDGDHGRGRRAHVRLVRVRDPRDRAALRALRLRDHRPRSRGGRLYVLLRALRARIRPSRARRPGRLTPFRAAWRPLARGRQPNVTPHPNRRTRAEAPVDRDLDRAGGRLRRSGWPFLMIAALVAAPGVLLILLGDGSMDGVGIALVTLALVPAGAGVALLLSGLVSWWAAQRKPRELVRIGGQSEPARGLQRAVVEERPRLVPRALYLAHEDVGAHVADSLELLEQLTLAARIASGGVAQRAQVAAVRVDQVPRRVLEHARRPLVVARVSGPIEDLRPLRPGGVGELARRGPSGFRERAGRRDREVRGDPRAQQQRGAQQPEQRGRAAAAQPDADLLRVRPPMAVEQRSHDRLGRRSGHRG